MTEWVTALLLKGVAGVAILFAYYVVVYRGSHFIGRFITNRKLYDFLFRERWHEDRSQGPAGRTGTGRDLRQD